METLQVITVMILSVAVVGGLIYAGPWGWALLGFWTFTAIFNIGF
jgi:hypothetical protein